eukprot:3720869-Amphidinium_carterae.1
MNCTPAALDHVAHSERLSHGTWCSSYRVRQALAVSHSNAELAAEVHASRAEKGHGNRNSIQLSCPDAWSYVLTTPSLAMFP